MVNGHTHAISSAHSLPVRAIGYEDVRDALAHGIDDFRAMPTHLVFLGLLYPILMLIVSRAVIGRGLLPLLFPIISGIALIGPLMALGIYELSRRREQGLEVHWSDIFHVLRSCSIGAIAMLSILLAVIFVAWLYVAMIIYDQTLGIMPASVSVFARLLFTTSEGWTLIIVGNLAGFFFAAGVLAISVVSFPLLLDHHVDALVAVQTSLKAVAVNTGPMLLWGLIVGVALLIAALPLFVGLAVAIPVLGHATWHLYRKVLVS